MVRWQISITPPPRCRCHRRGEGDFILLDQAWGGEQTPLETTHITRKHAPQEASVCMPIFVCMFLCFLAVVLSVFSMKHKQQWRSALTALFPLPFAVYSNDTHLRTHAGLPPLGTQALWCCAEKTLHQTHSKRKCFSPRGEQQGLGEIYFDVKVARKLSLDRNLFLIPELKCPTWRLSRGKQRIKAAEAHCNTFKHMHKYTLLHMHSHKKSWACKHACTHTQDSRAQEKLCSISFNT